MQAEIDAIVAHTYNLTQNEYEHILDTFENGMNQNRLQTLKNLAIEAFAQKNSCFKKAS